MARKVEELYKEALALSTEEREELKRLLSMQAESGWASGPGWRRLTGANVIFELERPS
jgi:hypothetical protein